MNINFLKVILVKTLTEKTITLDISDLTFINI